MDLGLAFPPEAYAYGQRSSGETHGVVLTKPHVVKLILDLAGYNPFRDLSATTLIEPSCGQGAFLEEAVRRLCASRKRLRRSWTSLAGAIRAFDIDDEHVARSRAVSEEQLVRGGAEPEIARQLAEGWVGAADFLLTPVTRDADFVVGNPPYIRIEHLSTQLQAAYRRNFESLYDRADLYVAFIEHGLAQLSDAGTLAYICADRWTLNKYGQRLREIISSRYNVRAYVDLHTASPFDSEVIAYPAIFSLGRGDTQAVRVTKLAFATPDECREAGKALLADEPGPTVDEYRAWFAGSEPWVLTSPRHLRVLRELEERYPPLEESGATKVSIGVATGNDKIFIVDAEADIERDRLVPLVMRADISNGAIHDAGRFVINTFEEGAGTVDLADFPRLARYFRKNAEEVAKRHVAKKNPRSWFRTIDRVYPELVERPKLLIPDIAGSLQVGYDEGRFHPHHNLYYIVSGGWDPEVLGGLISSKVALFFIWSYAVRMRGGYLRFQAQYLRRIRVPRPDMLSKQLTDELRTAFRKRDFERLDALALDAYELPKLPDFDFVDTRT
jgi:hypothetical protein